MTTPQNDAQAWTAALGCPAPDVAHYEVAGHVRAIEDALVAVVRVRALADEVRDNDLADHATTAETALVRIGDALDAVKRALIREEARHV